MFLFDIEIQLYTLTDDEIQCYHYLFWSLSLCNFFFLKFCGGDETWCRHEVVGEVVEVGPEVTKFKVGDTVGVGLLVGCCKKCRPCEQDIEQYCAKKIWNCNDVYTDGKPTQGGFANFMVVEQK